MAETASGYRCCDGKNVGERQVDAGYQNSHLWQHRPEVAHPKWVWKLWACYLGATHGRAIFRMRNSRETVFMSTETKSGKDTLKVEKVSILVLGLCIAVLVYLVIARPF
jgi:hypothetical protein